MDEALNVTNQDAKLILNFGVSFPTVLKLHLSLREASLLLISKVSKMMLAPCVVISPQVEQHLVTFQKQQSF